MSKRNVEAIYPLSPMQQGMLFHSLYAPETGVYFEQLRATLIGPLDRAAFERAWGRVVERHAVLRTAFSWKSLDRMLQIVHRQVALPIDYQDWRGAPEAERDARLEAYLQADRQRGFDLGRAPLLRLALLRLADDRHILVWSHHHLLLDGWSMPLLLKEVFAFYEAFRQGRDLALEPARPYRDYIAWLGQQDLGQAEAYWRRTLRGFTTPTPLVVDRPGAAQPATAEERERRLSEPVTQALQTLARQRRLTLSTILQGAWALLLHRYSGEADVLFGATVSGRPPDLPGVEGMIGVFINTLPVRVRVRPEQPVVEWLQTLQAQAAEMRQYEYSPLVQVQGWSEAPRDRALFESLLIFENYPVDEALREPFGSLRVEGVQSREQTNYPLNLISGPGRPLTLKVSYDPQRFDADVIERLLGHLQTLLEGIAAGPERPVADVPLLTEAEAGQLAAWSRAEADLPVPGTVLDLFAAQAAHKPEAAAVIFAEPGGATQTLTYGELDRRSNQLAHALRARGVGPEALVALCVERSLEMIIGLLGSLKAGGAYLPLDPSYPPERLAFMLQDSGAQVLITQSHLVPRLSGAAAQVICLDTDWPEVAHFPITSPPSQVTPDSLAYAIYTSGSTGRPKGVLVEHRGLVNFIEAACRTYFTREQERLLQFASFSFDASVAEIFSTLAGGHTLVLAAREALSSPPDLHRLLQTQAITMVTLPPSMLAALSSEDLPALHTVLTAGEICPMEVARRWARGRRLINAYGPTEATIGPTWQVFDPLPAGLDFLPIGRPIPNTQLYVLDAQRRPVPVGVPGEIYIGGVGVARGYLNRPELTAEKFVPSPFPLTEGSAGEGGRLYRTGDRARWHADGNLEFLGRLDDQVKVRGFRIELGEIESALEQHPAVSQAVVVVREETAGDQRLTAYVVLADDRRQTADKSESSRVVRPPSAVLQSLRDFVRQRLPDYMLPAAFVFLDHLPLTPNGKVDHRALPAPDREALAEAAPTGARTPTEEVLAELWARVLKAPRVDLHDSFFDLGGHSLLATQLIARVRETFGVDVSLRALFEQPTVAGLAERVDAARRAAAGLEAPPLTPAPRQRVASVGEAAGLALSQDGVLAPLSFAQQRLWFIDQLAPGNLFYNLPAAVRLTGRLDSAALSRALDEIVRRHETLRTTFRTVDGQPVQVIAPAHPLSLTVIDLAGQPDPEAEAQRLARDLARQPFDLAAGPLLRARLFRLGEADHVAVLVLHHIIADAWSMGVLVRELAALYAAFAAGRPSPLPDLPIQYADFARWQRDWLQGDVLEKHVAYWRKQLAGLPPLLELPTDRPRPAVQTYHGASERLELPGELVARLRTLGRQEGATLFMTLLAAYQVLLGRYSGQDDVAVGAAIASRGRAEIEPLIGFFVNMLVMRGDLAGAPTFRELLQRTRETTLGAYAHQDIPFETLVEALQPGRDLSHTPFFQAAFTLQNTPFQALELPGLTMSPLATETGAAQYDLLLSLDETPRGLSGALTYNTDLFDTATARRLVGHFLALLDAVAGDPDRPITHLPLLTEAERQQMLVDWNRTDAPTPSDRGAHQLFEARAAEQPDAIALIFEDQTLTYAELNRRADRLARHLLGRGLPPETIVGLCAERSLEMVVGLLAIWKAGGAYLPLDPHYPAERLAFMLQDSGAPLLLTTAALAPRLPHSAAQVICLDTDWDSGTPASVADLQSQVTPDSLAYVIYTSGSTGQPKGTLLRHRGLCNLAEAQRIQFDIQPGVRVLQFAPLSFDASVWETVMALCNGGTLVLARQAAIAGDLIGVLRAARVNVVTLPPSVLSVLDPADLPDLRVVVSAGEACSREIVARWAPGRRFVNAYGPTETTVCASWTVCHPADPRPPSIGRPIANVQLYLLDRNLQPVPVGVPGELVIGGVGVARGYLNRPELTAEKFIPSPFPLPGGSAGDQGRLYRTGDLCRFRPDGEVEFLGRLDQQVKVRGFRIELGEIEAALRALPGVQDAVALARDDVASGDRRLAAYVILTPDRRPEASNGHHAAVVAELRDGLRRQLPEYMVPTYFVLLDAFPLSPSGKVDRRALPRPEAAPAARVFVAPRTDTERTLAALCAELLGAAQVGVHDSFFELGGHSLLATQLVSRVREAFQVELPLRSLFEHPTVAGLAELIDRQRAAAASDEARIAAMLAELETLSDEDARRLLEGELTA